MASYKDKNDGYDEGGFKDGYIDDGPRFGISRTLEYDPSRDKSDYGNRPQKGDVFKNRKEKVQGGKVNNLKDKMKKHGVKEPAKVVSAFAKKATLPMFDKNNPVKKKKRNEKSISKPSSVFKSN